MKSFLLAALLLAVPSVAAATQPFVPAAVVINACLNEQVKEACLVADAILDGILTVISQQGPAVSSVCLPPNVQRTEVASAVMNWYGADPSRLPIMDYSTFSEWVYFGVAQVYRCPTT